ncbi:low molecular weight protein-tyrosine-phosphatase [Pediococcus damnosus]|uniref:low molecular weight protein-tyrosine-phosphatase n=1 Tax=Pediococcus damnosus TaxID=51663 RepID=UPI000704B260|nr:low molecular weight protein-tyrosine-phosphatase [Pediococcus damnosus]KRN53576.1 tyrosine-phosphatase protein [Pediococcus damnosus]
MEKILFVCLGNICRSPMAEALFQQKINQANLTNQFSADSAGTSDWEEGNPPHAQTLAVLQKHHVDPKGLISRPVTTSDFQTFDWLIGMDHQNILDLKNLAPAASTAKIKLFMSVSSKKPNTDVPDPWYTHKFEAAYQQISAGVDDWIKFLTSQSK